MMVMMFPCDSYTCTSLQVSGIRSTRDPVDLVKSWLVGLELATEAEVKAVEQKVRKEVEAAVAKAKAASPPPKEELTRDIYSGPYAPPRMCNL